METMLTTREAAEKLRVSVRTLMKWRKLGKGPPAHKTERKLLYSPGEVQDWLKRQPAK
ncbi:MAG: helix-turn-helix domain-containing protein [Candidatus Competibacteraceae bacterium]|nr:helix-turn-helix domain-containing protein [Candidatus Competibacteraceae bacterium]